MSWNVMNVYEAAIRFHLQADVVESNADILALVEDTDESVWYAACRVGNDVCGFVVLFDVAHRDRDLCLVKIVVEDEGPEAIGAPLEVLDQLSPTSDPTANQWRGACRNTNLGIPTIRPYSASSN